MALICGDLTLVTCIEQLLGLDHFLCALLMFYHADFYSKCSVVAPVPQQRPLELQVFALPCCSCSDPVLLWLPGRFSAGSSPGT